MKSFAHRPVTLKHPPVPVTAKNWKKYSGGQTGGEVVRDGEFVRCPLVFMDQALINAYERDGIKELSVGYSTDLQWRTGIVDAGQPDAGQHYDAVQTAIRGNHLAVVPLARGGDQLRIGDSRRKSLAFDIENDFRILISRINDMDEDEDEGGDYTGDGLDLYDTDFTEDFTEAQRQHLAETGASMPGGGFPIRNSEDLHHAMEAIGRASNPGAARAHIRERAKALGLEGELSASFKDAAIHDAWSDEARAAAIEARKHGATLKPSARPTRGAAATFDVMHPDNAISPRGLPSPSGTIDIHHDGTATSYKEGESKTHKNVKGAIKHIMKDASFHDDTKDCPNCGAEIPTGAKDCPECHTHLKDGVTYMTKIVIDGVPVNVADEQTAAIIDRHVASLTRQLADAKKDMDKIANEGEDKDKDLADAKKTISTRDGEIAVLKKQVDDAKVTPAKLDQLVKDRLSVIDAASNVLDKTFAFDGKSVEDIKRATVDAYLGDAAKGMDDTAISGAFVAATAVKDGKRGGSQPIRDALRGQGSRPGNINDARDTAYDQKTKDLGDAWRKKPAA